MACYHIDVKVISRGSGRSSVAAAAYRSRDKIYDERQGMTFDYTRKKDLAYAEIMLPKNSPERWKERSILWNDVERTEKRKDAQLAREVELSLPTELNLNQQITLVRDYAQKQFVDQGMIADVCIHKSEKNPHVHIMLTMREVTPEGFGQKQRSWNDKNHLLTWREEWAVVQNRHLLQAGYDIQVDHRSYEERGINLEPKLTLGPGIYRYLPKGYLHLEDTRGLERLEEYQRVCRENGNRIIGDPDKALKHLGHYDAVFKREDILDFAFRHSADKEQFNRVVHALEQSQELVKIGKNEKGEELYTTRTMLEDERVMLETARIMKETREHAVEKTIMDQTTANYTMSKEQDKAFRGLLKQGDIAVMIGRAGTGKSYTLGAVREAYEAQGYKIRGLALSGIAAEGLQNESGIPSVTIYKQLDDWDHGREKLRQKEVLVIDEAGMVGTRQMHQVLEYAHEAGAKVILVGDNEQLQAIEAGGSFRGIIQKTGYCELAEIRRQEIDWQKQATKDFSGDREQVEQAIDTYHANGNIKEHTTKSEAKESLLQEWANWNAEHKSQTSLMMAYTNKDVQELNQGARAYKKNMGDLRGPEHYYETERGQREFMKGDRILFLRNERSLGVRNGSLGTVEKAERGSLIVQLDKGSRVAIDTHMYKDFDYGYAATVHKTQGATLNRTFVLGTRHFDKHTAYVAMSRHRQDVVMHYGKDEFKDLAELKMVMSRPQPKSLVVDYAIPRGVCVDERLIQVEKRMIHTERSQQAHDISQFQAEEAYIKRMETKGTRVEFPKDRAVEGFYLGIKEVGSQKYAMIESSLDRQDRTVYMVPYQEGYKNIMEFRPVAYDGRSMQQQQIKAPEKGLGKGKGPEREK